MVGSITQSKQVPSTSSSDVPLPTNDTNKPSIGRPRVPYNQASARTKYEILKKATKIYDESDRNLKNQIDNISQGCCEEVLMEIYVQKESPPKVDLLKKSCLYFWSFFSKKVSSLGELRGGVETSGPRQGWLVLQTYNYKGLRYNIF